MRSVTHPKFHVRISVLTSNRTPSLSPQRTLKQPIKSNAPMSLLSPPKKLFASPPVPRTMKRKAKVPSAASTARYPPHTDLPTTLETASGAPGKSTRGVRSTTTIIRTISRTFPARQTHSLSPGEHDPYRASQEQRRTSRNHMVSDAELMARTGHGPSVSSLKSNRQQPWVYTLLLLLLGF